MGLFHGKITDTTRGIIEVDVNGVNRPFIFGDFWAAFVLPTSIQSDDEIHVELDTSNSMAQPSRVWGPDGSVIFETLMK